MAPRPDRSHARSGSNRSPATPRFLTIRDLLAGAGGKLAPLFEVHVKRHRWNVMEGDATIEVALDLGKVVAADRQAPLCEIEFEKKAGAPTALFALARKVDQITPAHLGVLSKAERGYRLLGAAPGAVKANPTSLTSDMSPATAFARIAAACLRQFVSMKRRWAGRAMLRPCIRRAWRCAGCAPFARSPNPCSTTAGSTTCEKN